MPTEAEVDERIQCFECDELFEPEAIPCICRVVYNRRNFCADCCENEHYNCTDCGSHYADSENYCPNCDTCGGCCRCGEEEYHDSGDAPRDYYRDPVGVFTAESPKDRKLHKSRRLVGLEIEFNYADNYSPLGQWRNTWKAGWHSDGSCGEELVTAPMAGDHIGRAMADLAVAMKAAGGTINSSCGLHVHVDGCDLFWSDIERLVKVYAMIEPVLYMLGGQDRAASQWCEPLNRQGAERLKTAKDVKGTIAAIALGLYSADEARRNIHQNKPGKKGGRRYQGLNLMPWLAQRRRRDPKTNRPIRPDATIEFRIHGHTKDMGKAAKWAELLAVFVDWVSAATDKDVERLPKSAVRALCQIAPSHASWILAAVKAWRSTTYTKRSIVEVDCRCDACRDVTDHPKSAPTARRKVRTIGLDKATGRYCFRLAA